jgi:Reverse transcriptase (RNA-dependent DNA polymerase)
LLNTGHTQVVDADLSGYFDSIPHAELLRCVARRVVDRHILRLIKAWLVAPVEDDDGKGRTTRSRANRDNKKGTPQGSPISPLMSNLYMRRFVEGWRRLGLQQRWSAHIVNYADDFVICCKRGAEDAMAAMREIMERIKLTVNEDKTHLCQIPRERFDFLGYTFGRCYGGVDDGSRAQAQPTALQDATDLGEDGLTEVVLLEQVAELQDGGGVGHRLAAEVDADECTQCRRVVQGFFAGHVSQVEPVLQQVNAQHALQTDRRAAVAGLGVVRLDQSDQIGPRHQGLHLGQEGIAPRWLPVLLEARGSIRRCSQTHLLHRHRLPTRRQL